MTPAERWGKELVATMRSRSVPVRFLAKALGTGESSISQARSGRYLPSIAQAARYSEALMAPRLLSLCRELRTRACEVCERTFVEDHNGGYPQRWCSDGCKWVGRKRDKREKGREATLLRYDRWKRLAIQRQRLIDQMCRTCEPEGACRQPECALRKASPLPLMQGIRVPVAETGTVRLDRDDPRRKTRRAKSQAAWARKKRAAA